AEGADINFEETTEFTLTVEVTDGNGGTTSSDLSIDVTNVNETPIDLSATSLGRVNENVESGTVVANISVADTDADDSHTFTLSGEGSENFTINENGEVVVAEGGTVNFEEFSAFDLTVTATDAGGLSIDTPLRITVRDINESPTTITVDNLEVDENTGVNAIVANLTTDNPEAADFVSYEIVGGSDEFFTLGNRIRVKAGADLDHEDQSEHTITIRATDRAGNTTESEITINVNDINEAPTAVVSQPLSIDENSDGGTVVATLSPADQDVGDSFTFQIVDFNGQPQEHPTLEVNENGELVVKDGADIDFEATPQIGLNIQVTDSGGLSVTQRVVVDVNDIDENPAPTDITFDNTAIDENSASGVTVATLGASDENQESGHTFEISGPGADVLEVDGNRLVVKEGAEIDFEATSEFTFTVTTTDDGGKTFTEEVTFTVNDLNEGPTDLVVSSDNSVAENTEAGSVVATLAATDVDGDALTYTLSGEGSENFTVNENGEVVVAEGADINFEEVTEFTLNVEVTDGNGGTTSGELAIDVTNVNETPIDLVAQGGDVAENVEAGTVVANLSVGDTDANDTHTFELSGEGSENFAIVDGQVVVAEGVTLDHEDTASFDLTVTATDAGGLSIDTPLQVNVADVNEGPTDLVVSSDNSVAENTEAGSVVATLAATDVDGDALTYTLSGEGSENFTVNENGEVVVAEGADINFEEVTEFTLNVEVTDGNGGTTSGELAIDVTNVNETPIDLVATGGDVAENVEAGTVVANLSVGDTDAGDTHTFELSGEGSENFAIVDGQVVVAEGATIDFEDTSSYDLTITATDAGGLSVDTSLVVNVGDVDENVVPIAQNDTVSVDTPDNGFFFVNSSQFGTFDPETGTSEVLGDTNGQVYSDVAVNSDGEVFALVFPAGDLVELDPSNGDIIQSIPSDLPFGTNALVVAPDGEVYASAFNSTELFSVDLETGESTVVGDVGAQSGGDLAIVDGELYLATLDQEIIRIDLDGAEGGSIPTEVVASDFTNGENIFGIASNGDGELIAIDTENRVYGVDIETGETVEVQDLSDALAGDVFGIAGQSETAGFTSGNVLANDTDADGDALTVTAIEFDGQSVEVGSEIEGEFGTFTLEADGSFTFQINEEADAFAALDGGEIAGQSLTYTVTDAAGESATATLTANVTGDNDAPVDINWSNDTIAENSAAGTVVATINIVDVDAGDSHTIELSGEGADQFEVVDGQLVVAEGANLDFETATSHDLTLTVTDEGGNVITETVSINVSDVVENQAPVDLVVTGTVQESQTGQGENLLVNGSFEADDVRDGGFAQFNDIEGWQASDKAEIWDSLQGREGSEGEQFLELDGRAGEQNSISQDVQTVDGETYTLTFDSASRSTDYSNEVEVYWNGELVDTIDANSTEWQNFSFEVEGTGGLDTLEFREPADDTDSVGGFLDNISLVSNNTLVESSEGIQVDENAVAGTEVADLAGIDPDAGDTLTFTLVDGEGNPVEDDNFEIVGDKIVVKDGADINFEATESLSLNVQVADQDGATHVEEVTIDVNDITEVATTITLSSNDVDENAEGAVVGQLSTDIGDADVTFQVSDERFEVVDGQLQVKGDVSFDFETEPTVDVTVSAVESAGPSTLFTEDFSENNSGTQDFSRVGNDRTSEFKTETIDISNAEGVSISFELSGQGGLDESGRNADNITVYANVDGERIELVNDNGTIDNGPSFTFDNIPEGSELTIEIETDVSFSGESYSIDNIQVEAADVVQEVLSETLTIDVNDIEEAVAATVEAPSIDLGQFDQDGRGEVFDLDNGSNQRNFSTQNNQTDLDGDRAPGAERSGNGDDTIHGNGGDDLLFAGNGNDDVRGGEGNDELHGGNGNDTLEGGFGDDQLVGGNGTDRALFDGNREDYTVAENEDGTFSVTDNRDNNNEGTDTTHGVEVFQFDDVALDTETVVDYDAPSIEPTIADLEIQTDNTIQGDQGGNFLNFNNSGNEHFEGRGGDDTIFGGNGDDIIDGGLGNDTLHGDAGNDLFTFEAGDGNDTVHGGEGGGWTDAIELENVPDSSFGNSWTLTLDQGEITGQDAGALTLSDDSAGTINFDDGSSIDFYQIEQIQW
ncbi:MAG: cadherin domain-containing protein, partial [Hyphomicrobiales bacterium]